LGLEKDRNKKTQRIEKKGVVQALGGKNGKSGGIPPEKSVGEEKGKERLLGGT